MNNLQYKTLLSYLPGMASVVNSFNSEQVQVAVFDRLISALEERNESSNSSSGTRSIKQKSSAEVAETASAELEHDIIEGGSIHAGIDADG